MKCDDCGQEIVVAKSGITPNQAHVLDIIIQFIDENGYSPTIEDLMQRMQTGNSKTNTHRILKMLESRGRIRRQFRQRRSITVVN